MDVLMPTGERVWIATGEHSATRNMRCPLARGFTYMGVLVLVFLMGLALKGTGELWQTARQRDREAQLLRVGDEVRRAIQAYYYATPGAMQQYPPTLEALVLDARYLHVKRHLRRIPRDPFTGEANWGIVEAPEGGIMGIYSLSNQTALKRAHFRPVYSTFAEATRYDEWKFLFAPDAATGAVGKP